MKYADPRPEACAVGASRSNHQTAIIDALETLRFAADRLVDLRERLDGSPSPLNGASTKQANYPPLLEVLNSTPEYIRTISEQIDKEVCTIREMLRL